MTIPIIYTSILFFLIIIMVLFVGSVFRYIKRLLYVKNFSSYISVLEYYMDKAYDLEHKDKILAYSLEAFRMPDEEFEGISQDYVKLVRKYIGPTLLKEFVELYGDEETFIFIILDYFHRRYEEDEIRKTAMDNLTKEE